MHFRKISLALPAAGCAHSPRVGVPYRMNGSGTVVPGAAGQCRAD